MLAGEAKALHTTKRSSGIDVSDPELAEAWANVRQDSDPQIDWCALTYAEVRRNTRVIGETITYINMSIFESMRRRVEGARGSFFAVGFGMTFKTSSCDFEQYTQTVAP